MEPSTWIFVCLVVAAVVILFTLIPWFIAKSRDMDGTGWLLLVSLLFGFTLIGWVVCLLWAIFGKTKLQKRYAEAVMSSYISTGLPPGPQAQAPADVYGRIEPRPDRVTFASKRPNSVVDGRRYLDSDFGRCSAGARVPWSRTPMARDRAAFWTADADQVISSKQTGDIDQ